MSIELISSETIEEPLARRVTRYKLVHKEAGRGGTWLTLALQVTQHLRFKKIEVTIPDLAPEIESDNVEEALDKLADWMERGAKELRARGKPAIAVAHYPDANP